MKTFILLTIVSTSIGLSLCTTTAEAQTPKDKDKVQALSQNMPDRLHNARLQAMESPAVKTAMAHLEQAFSMAQGTETAEVINAVQQAGVILRKEMLRIDPGLAIQTNPKNTKNK